MVYDNTRREVFSDFEVLRPLFYFPTIMYCFSTIIRSFCEYTRVIMIVHLLALACLVVEFDLELPLDSTLLAVPSTVTDAYH